MSARSITRRSFLGAGAGALAGGLAWPARPLAAMLGPAPPRLRERRLGALAAGVHALALPAGADLIALEWHASTDAAVQLRLQGPDRRWSAWLSAAGCGAGQQSPHDGRAGVRALSAPVWSAGGRTLQVRAARALSEVRLHIVDASGGLGARRLAVAASMLGVAASATPLVPAVGAGQPPIIARGAWAQGVARPRVAPAYGSVRMAFVHHTETPNGYLTGEVPAMLRSIFAFHRYVRGWNDIGYNFVIDAFGRIFEARAGGIDEPVVGAHAGGFNLESTGVAVLGAFMSRPLSTAAARALQALLAWKLSLHGVPAEGRARVRVNPAGAVFSRFPARAHVWLPHIAGHRDGDSTDCPGDALYGELPAVRLGVRRLVPRVARATLALSAPGPAPIGLTAPAVATPAEASFHGSIALLDGTPVQGAAVKLQERSVRRRGEVVKERTLAEAMTDAAGSWSLPAAVVAAPGRRVWLRALYAGGSGAAPAAVSAPLALAAAVSR